MVEPMPDNRCVFASNGFAKCPNGISVSPKHRFDTPVSHRLVMNEIKVNVIAVMFRGIKYNSNKIKSQRQKSQVNCLADLQRRERSDQSEKSARRLG